VRGSSGDDGLYFERGISVMGKRPGENTDHQAMEAVGRLAGGIAHDFNNLLTTIMGYSDLLLANADDHPFGKLREDVEEIRRAAERAAGLTQQILAFSGRQVLQPQVTSVNDLLTEIEPLLRRTVGDETVVDLVLEPELGMIEVDRDQLAQVVMNLTTNARDAMPGGGTLRLETANVEPGEEFRGLAVEVSPGPHVVLSVSDTGVGMTGDTVSHMFEPFFTTKGPGRGTGLGLSTVYGVVRQSGGDVLVESEPGRGTILRIYFPRIDRAAPETHPILAPARLIAHESILVVEDEAGVRDLVTRVLTGRGYSVHAARDAAQALTLLIDEDRSVDLLLTDVVLPGGMQGDALAKKALDLRPGLPVLFMSGHPRHLLERGRALDVGVNYLQKPFTPDSLGRKVREVLDAAGQ
jgi:two-component system cell cycle sensor histidine kinase/response regulator CckA